MTAIYKKEMRAYFTSFIGYLFIAFLLIFVAIYQYVYNLYMGYANFAYAVNGTANFFLLLVPMLTMRILAEERRQKTDQLLFTSPRSVTAIILGKYLALITVFAIAIVIICSYPLILRRFGQVNLQIAYASILAFFLLGCAYMAIGLFVSALCESQILAAVLTFVTILFTLLVDLLIGLIPTGHLVAVLVLAGCVLLVGLILYLMMKNILVPVLVSAAGLAALFITYLINPQWYDGALAKVFGWFSVVSRFENFRYGIASTSAYVYYLSMMVLFVFLTIQAEKKRSWS